MDPVMDPELASEMVKLLAQELKVVRAQLREAERTTSTTPFAGGPSDRQALIAENDSLKADNAALQQTVFKLRAEASRVSAMKSEQDAEMPMPHTNEEFAKLLAENKDLIREKEKASRNQEKLSITRDKYRRTKAKVHEYSEVLNGLRVELASCTQELEQSRKEVVSEIDFRDFLNDVPYEPIEGQSELSSIPPYTRRRIKFPKMVQDVCNGPYFINNNEVIWSPSGIALGLVIKPAFQYNPKIRGGTWTKFKDDFKIGKQMDVCCSSGHTARYLGTYERVGGQGTMVIASEVLKHLDPEKLTFVSRSTTLFPDLVAPSQTQMIKNMYKQGVIKVQCFGIRCVALNQTLAEKLQEMIPSSVQRNPRDNTDISTPAITSGDARKRKRDPKSTGHSDRNKRRHGPLTDELNDT